MMHSDQVKQSHQISVGVTPVYSPGNPYQEQLRIHLEKNGVLVHDFKATTILLKRMIHTYKVDILHLHWLHPFIIRKTAIKSWFCGLVFLSKICFLRISGIKIVWTIHNLRDHEELLPVLSGLVRKLVTKMASAIIVHSKIARQAVLKDAGKSVNKKVHVVPHGHYIDCYPNHINKTEARKKLGITSDKFVYLFFGAVRQYKGVDKLIEAFNRLENPTAMLVIAGRALDEELNKKISNLCSNNDHIIFVSKFISPEDIQIYMNASDIVVFPYRKILTSGAVILAMSFRRPCIAPEIGCIPDVLDEKGAFLYQESDDPIRVLLEVMQTAHESSAFMGQLGEYNRERVEKWQWDRIAQKTAEIYHSVLQKL